MNTLYPDMCIKNYKFSGKLLIDGDMQDNSIMFRFIFDKKNMVHPLLIRVKVLPIVSKENSEKEHWKQNEQTTVFKCNIPDLNNPVMKTLLVYPDFLLKKHKIIGIDIESQFSCHVA